MKFKLGDHVRVIDRECKHFDKVGTVDVIDATDADFPFRVSGLTGADDHVVWFRDHELILADAIDPVAAEPDAVNHPPHYGGEDDPYEVIKVAEAWGFDKDAYLFNVLKYIARSDKKGKTLEDHKKARFYLDRKIKQLEAGQ